MTYNVNSLPSNRKVFEKISKKSASSYILDYVAQEYEAIISCPPVIMDYFASSKRVKSHYNSKSSRAAMNYQTSGLPSPPLSSPERKALSKYYNYSNQRRDLYSELSTSSSPQPISLRSYIESVVRKSRIDTGTLLSSLAYARRLKSKLSQTSKGMECTHHRIFLATLIIASKYIHDSALKNKYWVSYAQMFSASEINLMEKQLLQLLDYNLEIKSKDYNIIVNDIAQLYYHHKEYIASRLENSSFDSRSSSSSSSGDSAYYSSSSYDGYSMIQGHRLKPTPPLLSDL